MSDTQPRARTRPTHGFLPPPPQRAREAKRERERLEAAATKIAAVVRGKLGRKAAQADKEHFEQLFGAAAVVQANFRRSMVMRTQGAWVQAARGAVYHCQVEREDCESA